MNSKDPFIQMGYKFAHFFKDKEITITIPVMWLHSLMLLTVEKLSNLPINSEPRLQLTGIVQFCINQIINAFPDSKKLYDDWRNLMSKP